MCCLYGKLCSVLVQWYKHVIVFNLRAGLAGQRTYSVPV